MIGALSQAFSRRSNGLPSMSTFSTEGSALRLPVAIKTVDRDGLSAKRQQTPILHRVPRGYPLKVVLRRTNLAGFTRKAIIWMRYSPRCEEH